MESRARASWGRHRKVGFCRKDFPAHSLFTIKLPIEGSSPALGYSNRALNTPSGGSPSIPSTRIVESLAKHSGTALLRRYFPCWAILGVRIGLCVGLCGWWEPGRDESLLLGSPCGWRDALTFKVTESLRLMLWAFMLPPPVMRTWSYHVDLSSTHFLPDFYLCCSCQLRAPTM